MSAFMLTHEHIRVLVAAGYRYTRLDILSWYHDHARHELRPGDHACATDTGQMLWGANRDSINARYEEEDEAPLFSYRDVPHVDLVLNAGQVFKAIDCYAYQSCEHDGWDECEARAYVDALRKKWCRVATGYDKAPWGIPNREMGESASVIISLSDLAKGKNGKE